LYNSDEKEIVLNAVEEPKSEIKGNKSGRGNLTEEEKDEIEKARPSYCKLCRTCEEETDTAEDLSNHLMNNHQAQEVLENYGQKYIEKSDTAFFKLVFHPFHITLTGWFFLQQNYCYTVLCVQVRNKALY
jgi:hypothetical protein